MRIADGQTLREFLGLDPGDRAVHQVETGLHADLARCRNEPEAPLDAVTSTLASSRTTTALLSPNSSATFFNSRSHMAPMARPTAVEPVNEIMPQSGWRTSAWPVSGPPGSTCSTPGGLGGLLEYACNQQATDDRALQVGLEHHRIAQRERRRARPAEAGISTM